MKLYIASSWRNPYYPSVVTALRKAGHDVYDFRNPPSGGRSAHTEAGWMAGASKKVLVYIPETQEPELMYGLFDGICTTMEELVNCLQNP